MPHAGGGQSTCRLWQGLNLGLVVGPGMRAECQIGVRAYENDMSHLIYVNLLFRIFLLELAKDGY